MTTPSTTMVDTDSIAARCRVAIFEPYIFDTMYGNMRYIAAIFKYLDRAQFEPVLISPVEGAFLDTIVRSGGRCVVERAPRSLCRYDKAVLKKGWLAKSFTLLSLIAYTFRMSYVLLRERVDIVQCHNIRAVLMAGFAAKLLRKPLIYYIKGELENPLLDRIGFHLADRILFQGETNKWKRYPDLVRRHERKIEILGNGIELDDVADAEGADRDGLVEELGLDNSKINLVFVGVIKPRKGVKELLEAMVRIQADMPNTALYLVGDHCADEFRSFGDECRKFIDTHDLKDIRFTGWRPDVYRIVSLMDVFLLPSYDEGVPKSAIEAMALAKPVVATNSGSVPDLIVDGVNGILVESHDPEEFAERVVELLRDPDKRNRLGAEARKSAYAGYSIGENISGLERLYQSLI